MSDTYAIRNLRTGEVRPVKLACEPNEAMLEPDERLMLKTGDEWIEVVQRKVHPIIRRLEEILNDLGGVMDELEELLL